MSNIAIQQSFIIGDEWSYFKIYTGFKTADRILTDCVYPLAKSLEANQIIDKWFFIRYLDPKPHLRIRFHVDNTQKVPAVIMNFNHAIKPYIENELVWKIQADTYKRELERYGNDIIEISETLFFYDSEMICNIICNDKVQAEENLRWLLGLKAIDSLLDDFELSLQQKWELLNTLQENFGREFGIDSDYRRQFGQKYRTLKSQIENILDEKAKDNKEFQTLFEPIVKRSMALKKLAQQIRNKLNEKESDSLNDLLRSYVHMMINRLFRTQQRIHELILYDYLFRYYNSLQARQGGKVLETRNKENKKALPA